MHNKQTNQIPINKVSGVMAKRACNNTMRVLLLACFSTYPNSMHHACPSIPASVYLECEEMEQSLMMKLLRLWKVTLSIVLSMLVLLSSEAAGAATLSAVKTAPGGVVCLTVDDGYGRDSIIKILNLMRTKKVTCTFFVIGNRLSANPDLWKQAIKDGHEICYHTMNHSSVGAWSESKILQDLKEWNATAKRVLGSDYSIPKLARLPGGGGHENIRILKLFASQGYKLIGWGVDTYTGAIKVGKPIAKYVLSRTTKGSIILTHFNTADANAMSQYIDALRKKFTLDKVSTAVFPLQFSPPPKSSPTQPSATPPPVVVWGNAKQ